MFDAESFSGMPNVGIHMFAAKAKARPALVTFAEVEDYATGEAVISEFSSEYYYICLKGEAKENPVLVPVESVASIAYLDQPNNFEDRIFKQISQTKHPDTIAGSLEILGAATGLRLIDRQGIVWVVEIYESAYFLRSENTKAILYGGICDKISLPGLSCANSLIRPRNLNCKNNAQNILVSSGVQLGQHYLDYFGLTWRVGRVEDRLCLEPLGGSSYIDWATLSFVEIPGLELISTFAQREARCADFKA